MDIYLKMKNRLLDVIDPESNYTQSDFDREFKSVTQNNNNSFKLTLKCLNTSGNPNPEYATDGSSGFDLRANLHSPIVIEPLKRAIVSTGLFFEIQPNFEIQVRSRSGLAAKNGVVVLNSPGTVDADYRGEVKVILYNTGEAPFVVNNGDRIAQGIFSSVISKNYINFEFVDSINSETERNSGGFGSTGVK